MDYQSDQHSDGSPSLYPILSTSQLLYTMPSRIYPNDCGLQDEASSPMSRPKRKQVKNACTHCQKACKKCDDARPCMRCVKYSIPEECVNSTRKARKKGVKRGPYKKHKQDGKAFTEPKTRSKKRNSVDLSAPDTPEFASVGGSPYNLSPDYMTAGESFTFPPPTPPVQKVVTPYYSDFYVELPPQTAHAQQHIQPPAQQPSTSHSAAQYSRLVYSAREISPETEQQQHPQTQTQPSYEGHIQQSYSRGREHLHHGGQSREQTYSPVAHFPPPILPLPATRGLVASRSFSSEQGAHLHQVRQSSHAHHQARQIEQAEVHLARGAYTVVSEPRHAPVRSQSQSQQHHPASYSQSKAISSRPELFYYPGQPHQQQYAVVQYDNSTNSQYQQPQQAQAYYPRHSVTQYNHVHGQSSRGYD